MAKASKYTKRYRLKYWITSVICWVSLITPLGVYIIKALASDGVLVSGKVAVVGTVAVAIILTVYNIIAQRNLTCIIWVMLLGLFVAMKEALLPLIIMLSIVSILNDLVFCPLISHYKTQLIASKVVDEREKE